MKKMFFSLCVACAIGSMHGQETQPNPSLEDYAKKVENFGNGLPQEKVYLHMDNTCYFLGDTLWYKGYVTRTDQGTLTDLSRILYVELLTPDGYLVERQQLEMKDGTAHGAFFLEDSLYAGYYELRAYTRWMLNFGVTEREHSKWSEELFYDGIGGQMSKDFYRDYEKLYSRVFPVFDKNEQPGNYSKQMTVRPLRRYFKQKTGKPEIDLTFYPEGGDLVLGTEGVVAFEINIKEGQHLDAALSILDHQGNQVATGKVTHRGRGTFVIPDVQEGGYTAKFQFSGYDYSVNLPKAVQQGCAMQVSQKHRRLHIRLEGNQLPESDHRLGLQIMNNGVTRHFETVKLKQDGTAEITVSTGDFTSGVHQITLFNNEGRIYAERLVFIQNEQRTASLEVSGVKNMYKPFEPITLELKLKDADHANLSLSVRDHASDEPKYDNGNIMTELLLCSDLKGFVEYPEYYFERQDEEHETALDLLMLVQGWKRYSWKEMAGITPFTLHHMPEDVQTIQGKVRETYSIMSDLEYDNMLAEQRDQRSASEIMTTSTDLAMDAESSSGDTGGDATTYTSDTQSYTTHLNRIKPMKKEVNVFASYIQGEETLDLMQATENGSFYMQTPKLYEQCILMMMADELDVDAEEAMADRTKKDFMNEEAYPNYYVKLDNFYPMFPKKYSFYEDASPFDLNEVTVSEGYTGSFSDRELSTVTISAKKQRSGLRAVDLSKPALVIDAYEAFNHVTDCGFTCGVYDWKKFSKVTALAYVGDMGMDRNYFIQERYDGTPMNLKSEERVFQSIEMANGVTINIEPLARMGQGKREIYRKLQNIDKLYIYTDYAPREQGSEKYSQSNQPDVIIDYHTFEGNAMQRTYRDRYIIFNGYAVCEDFYSPDYSKKPLPEHTDYRRTLYWAPYVAFDKRGEAKVTFYNNSKNTTISIDAEGMGDKKMPLVWSKDE